MGVIVVTGASGALGSAVVDTLVARGDKVAGVVSPRSLEKLRTELGGKPGTLALALESWPAAVARVEAELGPIDGAVLVAGSWAGGKPLVDADPNELSGMLDANVATAHAAMRGVLPGMIQRKRGSVVIIGSRAAVRPWTSHGAAAYAASKAAVVALAEAAAAETVAHDVRINAVLPSTIDTPQNRKAMPKADASRWVSPASLAGVIAFLLSDAAKDVSGAAIPVYGKS